MTEPLSPSALPEWVEEHWSPERTLREWWADLFAAGLAFPGWPVGLGGLGLQGRAAREFGAAVAKAVAISAPGGGGTAMAAPTLLRHATAAQVEAFVPPLGRGEELWCQLFSEPGAGSDLASLRTRAERDGDEWVVDGQKVWTTQAHLADRGFLLARTDPAAPKHQGISYLIIDMDQPGVEVRPLRQMNGSVEFNEVFLTGARVPADRVVGDPGAGWTVAMTTLGFERQGAGRPAAGAVETVAGRRAGMLDTLLGDLVEGGRRVQRRSYLLSGRRMVALARERGGLDSPVQRDRVARYYVATEVHRFNGLRQRAAAAQGRPPGPEASIAKLTISNLARQSRQLSLDLLGPAGSLSGEDAPAGGSLVDTALSSFAAGLGGGTDEIQRNVIAERSLGLPRDPATGREASA